ncbi:MAG: hypothetical protein IKQ25_09145 [Lachnospiraceae bacterium]|jgi:hypothetical protein|nr:hypothetical protein [Lachnospiraceae bacterium]MBR6151434.1 hypothetical protein [Lachnospiraceae bacterium]
MDYELTKRYFKVVDEYINYKSCAIMIGVGALLFLSIAKVPAMGIFGLIIAGIGVFRIVSKKNKISSEKASIPSDEEYDNEVVKNLNNLKSKALNALGLDADEVKEIEPISFDGYVYKNASNAKKGKDDLWRTNKYEYVILFFSEHEVHCYTYNFDTTADKKTEATDVYFYKDIVSVSTASDSTKLLGQNIDYEYFKLTTAGGTALSVSLRDTSNAQRSINAMRTLLKAKKQQG